MYIKRLIILVGIIFLISGCGSNSADLATINGKKVSEPEFKAYLKFKRVDDSNKKRVDAVLDQYLERKALVDVIKDKNLLDKALLEIQMRFERSGHPGVP